MKLLYCVLSVLFCLPPVNDLFSQSWEGNNGIPPKLANTPVLFADDIIIDNQPEINQQNIQVCSAFNGDLYGAYSYSKQGQAWLKILKSENNGMNWFVLLDGCSYLNHTCVTNLDIIAAGNSASELKLFIGYCLYDSVTHYRIAVLSRFDTTGYFEDEILKDYSSCIKYIAIASDYMYPAVNSNPYSIAAVYSKTNYFDTIFFCSSGNGGMSIDTRIKLAHSGNYFDKVDIAYGRCYSQGTGRYFVAWEEKQNKDAAFGHIYTAHTEPYFNSSFTDPILLDTLDASAENHVRNPVIACQFNEADNDSSDLTGIILCEKHDSLNETNNVIGFYNKTAAISGNFTCFTLDPAPGNKLQPDICFNPFDSTFNATYFDSTLQKLPYLSNNYNLLNPDVWNVISTGYNDNPNLSAPNPTIKLNRGEHSGMNAWIARNPATNGLALFDAPYHFYTGFNEKNQKDCFVHSVFPNPCSDHVTVEFKLSNPENISFQLLSPVGQRLLLVNANYNPDATNQLDLDMSGNVPGIYFYTIQAGDLVSFGKIIIMR